MICNSYRVGIIAAHPFPRVALRLPWALLWNAFGVPFTSPRGSQIRRKTMPSGYVKS